MDNKESDLLSRKPEKFTIEPLTRNAIFVLLFKPQTMKEANQRHLKRGKEITERYLHFLDTHIAGVVSGDVVEFMEINEIATELFVSHKHLTDTVQKETGNHPCHFYDLKIIDEAKKLLSETNMSIAKVAQILTYDPSNFSKFFKKFTGQTPGQFKKNTENCR